MLKLMFYLEQMNDWFLMYSTILKPVTELNWNSAEILLVSLFFSSINSSIQINTKQMLNK